jgi:hypothetical protein
MDFVIATFSIIGSFFGSIFGNILAHDFCEFTPKFCRQLIERAVHTFPNQTDRERYSEEWLAHLAECTGVIEQYTHAATCIFGARRLRRIAEPTEASFKRMRVEFDGIGIVDLNYATGMAVVDMVLTAAMKLLGKQSFVHRLPKTVAYLWIFLSSFCIGCFKHRGANGRQIRTLVKFGLQAIREENNRITVDIDGRRVDLSKATESAGKIL